MSETAHGSRVGSQFGPYRLTRLLGRGGMGEVYEAEHTVKEWTVALKLLSDAFSQDPVFRKRMQREARIAGRLQEPHVVPIHDYGEIDGQLFLEMRLVEGNDLDALLKRFGPLTPARAVAIIHQIASALDAAHAADVMHRDIKPQNILVTRDDFAYLVDFGIASATTDERLTSLGTAVGTWKYMAPERFTNAEVTHRADIYSLTCVLHECLTGSPPYRADSASMLVTAHLMDPIPKPSTLRPGIPRAFDAVIARGMAKKPEERYASAGDLARAAHDALSDPDQDHAANILRRSEEKTLPASAPTQPGTVNTPAQTWAAPPKPYPGSAGSGPLPRTEPGPAAQPGWTPTSGPIPASAQPSTPAPRFFQSAGGWSGQPPAPPPQQPPRGWMPGPPPPPPRKRNVWPIAAVAALVIAVALGAVTVFVLTRPKPNPPPPPLPPERLSGLLLSTTEIDGVMGASNMQPEKPLDSLGAATTDLSNPDCRGAIDAGRVPVYAGSSYTGVSAVELHEPGDSFDHWVIQYAIGFPSADKAAAFLSSSAAKWKACAGQNVAVTENGQTNHWSLGTFTGGDHDIGILNTSEGANGWACQRALKAESNVVMDVTACEYSGLSDQASQIAAKMAAKITQ